MDKRRTESSSRIALRLSSGLFVPAKGLFCFLCQQRYPHHFLEGGCDQSVDFIYRGTTKPSDLMAHRSRLMLRSSQLDHRRDPNGGLFF